VLGIEPAKARLKTLVADAEKALAPFGARAAVLVEAAKFSPSGSRKTRGRRLSRRSAGYCGNSAK